MYNFNPKRRSHHAKGYPVAYAAPGPKFSNGRIILLAAGILLVSNFLTYMFSAAKEDKKEMVYSIKTESLYLIDKASQYIADVSVFETKVRQVARNLDIPPEWLMAVMYTESRFDPSVQNFKGSGATGLIQFMVPTVRELNNRMGTQYYMSDIRRMEADDQMVLVQEYLETIKERYGEFNSLTDLYLGILYPRAIGQDYCYTLFAYPSKKYKQNSGLDENKDHAVTVSDIDSRLKRMFPTAYMAKK
ncbi:MAG: transglycosylase SLT domain-containing protein [Bacteroidia bacterium]|nr:transglycosylase SLT domain-containing protein [Bacteroidia bacterium]